MTIATAACGRFWAATHAHKLPTIQEGTQIATKTLEQNTQKTFAKIFTTKPKLRRVIWHKQQIVRNRAYALQESFYPTTDVRYEAAKQRIHTLLRIFDRMSILAYLGRPESVQHNQMDQTVRYLKSGATVPKRHYFQRKLPAKKGYIEILGLGYVYTKDGEWWIHWNHTTQLTLSALHERANPPTPPTESEEVEQPGFSKVDFSLSYNTPKRNKQSTPNNQCEPHNRMSERRERFSIRERNCESESRLQNSIVQHSEEAKLNQSERATLRSSGKDVFQ